MPDELSNVSSGELMGPEELDGFHLLLLTTISPVSILASSNVVTSNNLTGRDVMDTPTAGILLREVARLHAHSQRELVACCNGTTSTQCLILTEVGATAPRHRPRLEAV